MGRKKKEEIEKKVKIGVSVDPELPQYFKDKSINLSSLVNKLLKELKNGGSCSSINNRKGKLWMK